MSDRGHELEFGVFVTPSAPDAAAVVDLARLADAGGLDLVSFQDHPYQPGFLDTWTLLSFVAAATTRVRLAPNVLNLPLRPPAVLARAVASLDILSGGRAELGIGAGAFWEAIEAMGGERLRPGESVDALEEAIDLIRMLWDTGEPRGARFEGERYRLAGAKRGPAPLHPVGIWIGAYKPRMLELTGRKGDGWLPSLAYLEPGQLAAGNARIDAAAEEAGRDPAQIRRLLNVPADLPVEELAELALAEGVSTFIAAADDEPTLRAFAEETAPQLREVVERERRRGAAEPAAAPVGGSTGSAAAPGGEPAPTGDPGPRGEYARLGVTPTPDDGSRLSEAAPWDEEARPHRPESGPEVTYTDTGRQLGQHLVDVHDVLRRELTELRDVVARVREGALGAGAARSALNEMAMRQNDWTLGAFCSRYCAAVTQHHGIEDASVFPHLARSEEALEPVISRLTEEHLVIHDAIEAVDAALVHHISHPDDFDRLQGAIDFLTDALLSHLSYEEREIVEPLARLGFQPGQV